jgi:two-component system nitrate/nitrite sensor histidine kinase NarX
MTTLSQQAFAAVQRDWSTLKATWTALPAPGADRVGAAGRCLRGPHRHLRHRHRAPPVPLTAILNAVQFVMVALTIGSAIALLYSAYLFIFNPLSRLQAGLARVEAGDLGARVDPWRQRRIRRPRGRLQPHGRDAAGAVPEPRAKVQEKTERLEAERATPGGPVRGGRLRGMRAETLDALAQGIARQVRQVARADASAVRWSDEANRKYLLLASDCLPQAVVDEELCIPTGDCLCGQPQGGAATRVIPILPDGPAARLGRCAKEGFQTVISVPVRLHERMVGELNLFYRARACCPTTTAPCWRPWPATWPVPSRACAPRPCNARPPWPRSAASSRANCTTPSPRAWPS